MHGTAESPPMKGLQLLQAHAWSPGGLLVQEVWGAQKLHPHEVQVWEDLLRDRTDCSSTGAIHADFLKKEGEMDSRESQFLIPVLSPSVGRFQELHLTSLQA